MADDDPRFCSYEEFGRLFFARAVTSERVLAGVTAASGRPIEVGPLHVGPGGLATVTAHGTVGDPVIHDVSSVEVAYRVDLPVSLDLEVDLQLSKHRFHAELEVPIDVVAHATRDLEIVVEVTPPSARDVTVDLKADGLRSSVLQRLAGIDDEIAKVVAKQVARQVGAPEGVAARTVDVGRSIDAAGA